MAPYRVTYDNSTRRERLVGAGMLAITAGLVFF